MNKADLVNEVANVVSTKTEAQAAVDCVFESIVNTLKKGDVVTWWDSGPSRWSSAKRAQAATPRPAQKSKSAPPTPPSLCRAKLSRMP